MDFYFSQFIAGINDSLTKVGYDSVFDLTGSIFPTIENQAKWKFSKHENSIGLHDGVNQFVFHAPEGIKENEDFPLVKVENSNHSFDSHNTAQVHRADPGSIYFTVQDGHGNPTYTFKHISEAQWRAIPKIKTAEECIAIDEDEFLAGIKKIADDENSMFNQLVRGGIDTGKSAIDGAMAVGNDPILSAGVGLGAGAAYDLAKRRFYNSEEENNEETPTSRIKRYLIPALAGGLGGGVLRSSFPNYYNEYPVWTAK
jgi:hypothetical protein